MAWVVAVLKAVARLMARAVTKTMAKNAQCAH